MKQTLSESIQTSLFGGRYVQLVKYGPAYLRIRRRTGLFSYEDFLIQPGGAQLTQIPIAKKKEFGKLKLLWLKFAPEWYRRHKRRQAHMRFLDKQGYPKHSTLYEYFGTPAHIEAEKIRIMRYPTPDTEFIGDDPTSRRPVSVHDTIRSAIAEVRAKAEVKE